jgi:O-antigen ligase
MTLTRARTLALGLFFLALAVSISASQILLAVLVVLAMPWDRWRPGQAGGPSLPAPDVVSAASVVRRHPLTPPIVAYIALSVASALASGDYGWSLWIARDVLRVATFYVVLLLTRSTAHAVRLWQGFLVLLSLMAGYGLLQAYVCRARPGWLGAVLLDFMCVHPTRVSGPFSIYMTFGGVLLLGTLFFLAYLSNVPWREAWWMVPASVVSLVALGLTYSRNAWLGLGAGVLALVLTARQAARILLVLAVLGGLAAAVTPSTVLVRARSMLDLQDSTARDRLAMWRSGLSMIADYPVLGVGPSTGHLHNAAIQIAAERGLPALFVWIWLWVRFFREARGVLARLPASAARARGLVCASLAGVTGFLVAGLFEHNFGDAEVVMLVYALMALPFIVAREPLPARPVMPPPRATVTPNPLLAAPV